MAHSNSENKRDVSVRHEDGLCCNGLASKHAVCTMNGNGDCCTAQHATQMVGEPHALYQQGGDGYAGHCQAQHNNGHHDHDGTHHRHDHRHHDHKQMHDVAERSRCSSLSLALTTLFAFGSANQVLFKTMFRAYGERGAFFVSQGVNVLYVVYGAIILYPRMWCTKHVTPEMRSMPQTRFMVMGLLDCMGTFFGAMGAVYTPGQVQALLNQSIIPFTMMASALYLGTRFTATQLIGATLVLAGAAIVVVPSILNPSWSADDSRWYAELLFCMSNLPMAFSQVYKEKNFKKDRVDVIYLTQCVSVWQLLFGFVLAPLQTVPGIGTAHGMSVTEIITSFDDGIRCFMGRQDRCRSNHAATLMLVYVAVNFMYTTSGLYVSKHGSAVLNSITFAILLPINTLLFCVRPLLGPYTEHFRVSTLVSLALVIVGFCTYEIVPTVMEQRRRRRQHYVQLPHTTDTNCCDCIAQSHASVRSSEMPFSSSSSSPPPPPLHEKLLGSGGCKGRASTDGSAHTDVGVSPHAGPARSCMCGDMERGGGGS